MFYQIQFDVARYLWGIQPLLFPFRLRLKRSDPKVQTRYLRELECSGLLAIPATTFGFMLSRVVLYCVVFCVRAYAVHHFITGGLLPYSTSLDSVPIPLLLEHHSPSTRLLGVRDYPEHRPPSHPQTPSEQTLP